MKHYILPFLCILFLSLIGCMDDKKSTPRILLHTSIGNIMIEVYPEKAPVTVANFLQYIDKNAYDGATFYRATRPSNDATISVLQGGLWKPWVKDMVKNYKSAFPSISHETTQTSGIRHANGAISMGRLGIGTANSEFFISIGDNPSLDFGGDRHLDGQGFAAFGRVAEGMDVVRAIHAMPTEIGEGFKGQILAKPIEITSIIIVH